MVKTLHDRYVAALESRGWRVNANARTGKYTEMVQGPEARDPLCVGMQGSKTKMFVGRSGAVRYGSTVSGSFSMIDGMKAMLLKGF